MFSEARREVLTDGLPAPEVTSTLLILTTLLHVLALFFTLFRLWFRYHTRRLWWDDLWAALALLCDIPCMVAMWILSAPGTDPYRNIEALPTPAESRSAHVISAWLILILYSTTIWFARISVVSSVIRIVPPARFVSVAVFSAGGLFFCMWAYILTCKSVVCSMDNSWHYGTVVQCVLPEWVALSEVCADVLSDAVLVLISLRLLWRVKLPSDQRIMIMSVFSTSILVSVVSVVHAMYIIPEITFVGRLLAEMEGAVSLVVCNLLVIVTFIYRVMRHGRDLTDGLCDKATEAGNGLTTVDPDFVGRSWFTPETTQTGSGFTPTTLSSVVFSSRANDSDQTLGSVAVLGGGPGRPDKGARAMSISIATKQ